MNYTPHYFQSNAIERGVSFFQSANRDSKLCIASPTGTGKSIMELILKSKLPDTWLITPRYEILEGMLSKIGKSAKSKSKNETIAFEHGICTPVKFRNMLMKGTDIRIKRLLVDEGHHYNAETYGEIEALTRVPSICFTASPYRGTPKGTKVFRDTWGEPYWAITYRKAYEEDYINMPWCETVPLLDDDVISIQNGEFVIESVTSEYETRMEDIVGLIKLDKPTMVAAPGHELLNILENYCKKHKIPYVKVVSETPNDERVKAFAACIACKAVLLQINVVSEGVDLPIRRLIDLAPTMSPVKWIQMLGRIMRPSDELAEYICTNRNLMRHAYLLEGCMPPAFIAQAQQAFPISNRIGTRVLGLECIGKFTPIEVPFKSGLQGHIYCMSSPDPNNSANIVEYAAIIHPALQQPIWAKKVKIKKSFDPITQRWDMDYGKWERTDAPVDLKGFKSLPVAKITERMGTMWKNMANGYGLDKDAEVTRKNFQALPILKDLRLRLE